MTTLLSDHANVMVKGCEDRLRQASPGSTEAAHRQELLSVARGFRGGIHLDFDVSEMERQNRRSRRGLIS